MAVMNNHVADDSTEIKEKVMLIVSNMIKTGEITKSDLMSLFPGKGREVPELPTFTFPSSGIEAKVRKLGPFTLDAVRSQMIAEIKPPEPPKVVVNYGTDENPEFKTETNEASQEYRDKLAEYERTIEEGGARKLIDVIIENAIIVDIDEGEVKFWRSFLVSMGIPEHDVEKMSNHTIYVKHVCIKTTDDLTSMQNFVIGASVPSEALVKAHEDSFRGEVQG